MWRSSTNTGPPKILIRHWAGVPLRSRLSVENSEFFRTQTAVSYEYRHDGTNSTRVCQSRHVSIGFRRKFNARHLIMYTKAAADNKSHSALQSKFILFVSVLWHPVSDRHPIISTANKCRSLLLFQISFFVSANKPKITITIFVRRKSFYALLIISNGSIDSRLRKCYGFIRH